MPRQEEPARRFRYFNASPRIIRPAVLMYVRFPLSLRKAEDLLCERGNAISSIVRHKRLALVRSVRVA